VKSSKITKKASTLFVDTKISLETLFYS